MKRTVTSLCIAILSGSLSSTLWGHTDHVKPGESSAWSTGTIVGKKIKSAKRGMIFATTEADILFAQPDYQDGDRSEQNLLGSKKMAVSTQDRSVKQALSDIRTDEAVVLTYKYKAYPFNPSRLIDFEESRYLIEAVSKPRAFKESKSYKKHGGDYQFPEGRRGYYDESTVEGTIYHVSRWGKIGGQACTAYVHVPKELTYSLLDKVQLHHSSVFQHVLSASLQAAATIGSIIIAQHMGFTPSVSLSHHSNSNHTSTESYKVIRKQGLTQLSMDIYSESGCRYAEDLAKSQESVSIDYATSYFWQFWHWHKNTALRMRLLNK
ncbi:MAG: hypothetical protein H6618_08290 [Deltaproteobacteria bacterium]|nr:hypothetical protein [Deltaproteobacteria bacterium]